MNEETTKLIEQLAQKLGTTAEYLWGVLINQASISAITDLLYIVLVAVGGILLFKAHKFLSKEDGHGNSFYYNWDFTRGIMIALTFIWSILFIAAFFSIVNIINGFFNPEYWALNKILNLI